MLNEVEVVEEEEEVEEVQTNPMIKRIGRTRNATPVERKDTHCPIVLKMPKKMTTMSQEQAQQAALRSCERK